MKNMPRAPRVTVEVTNEVIRDSVQRDSSHCMIAESLKRAHPDARRVAVDLQTIRFTDPKKGLRFTYLTPRTAQVAIVKYDQGLLPDPFSFRLGNGQVTRANTRANGRAQRQLSKKQLEQRQAATKSSVDHLAKARLRPRDGQAASKDNPPDRVGGKPPPVAPGARRAFGLRGLER
jgi:hypothetical protein